MADLIKCPQCGHNEVNVAIWGSATTRHFYHIDYDDIENVNIDFKDDQAYCTKCEHEAHYSDFHYEETENEAA